MALLDKKQAASPWKTLVGGVLVETSAVSGSAIYS